jgi:hypothetical protein
VRYTTGIGIASLDGGEDLAHIEQADELGREFGGEIQRGKTSAA